MEDRELGFGRVDFEPLVRVRREVFRGQLGEEIWRWVLWGLQGTDLP